MTQAQLDDAVAEATGEPSVPIRGLGFSLVPCRAWSPRTWASCVACPFCGRGVAYPGRPATARRPGRVPACDVYFDFAPDEVYAAGPARP